MPAPVMTCTSSHLDCARDWARPACAPSRTTQLRGGGVGRLVGLASTGDGTHSSTRDGTKRQIIVKSTLSASAICPLQMLASGPVGEAQRGRRRPADFPRRPTRRGKFRQARLRRPASGQPAKPSRFCPCGTQGQNRSGRVAHTATRRVLVCHRHRTELALCATRPARYEPCAPHGHNDVGLGRRGDSTAQVRMATGASD
jgi:hypothetical protein